MIGPAYIDEVRRLVRKNSTSAQWQTPAVPVPTTHTWLFGQRNDSQTTRTFPSGRTGRYWSTWRADYPGTPASDLLFIAADTASHPDDAPAVNDYFQLGGNDANDNPITDQTIYQITNVHFNSPGNRWYIAIDRGLAVSVRRDRTSITFITPSPPRDITALLGLPINPTQFPTRAEIGSAIINHPTILLPEHFPDDPPDKGHILIIGGETFTIDRVSRRYHADQLVYYEAIHSPEPN